jgi:hypothetical protein
MSSSLLGCWTRDFSVPSSMNESALDLSQKAELPLNESGKYKANHSVSTSDLVLALNNLLSPPRSNVQIR